MKTHKFLCTAVFTLAVSFGLFFVSFENSQSQTESKKGVFKKLERIFQTAQEYYVDSIDSAKLEVAAIEGMLKTLDPYSKYFPPKRMSELKEDLRGNYEGIGIETVIEKDTINIINTTYSAPAKNAGLRAGDKIVAIDGISAIAIPRDSVSARLRGPGGTLVVVDIKRDNVKDILRFEIIRHRVPIFTVICAFMIKGTDIGYIYMNSFAQRTHAELLDSLEALKSQGMKKLILDLHGNPGGYMNQATLIADEFVKDNNMIVFTKSDKKYSEESHYSTANQKWEDIPLICLTDKHAASASEILMGAIQDLDRGLIIGETSYGKGLVQRQYDIADGSGYRITIARYHTPSGRCIQRPYEDKTKYYNYEGRIELKDGAKLEDLLTEWKKQIHKDSLPPLFKTVSGRTVLGGGGITPDYYAKYDTLPPFVQKLKKDNMFYHFACKYLRENQQEFESKYLKNFDKFLNSFEVTDKLVDEFKTLAQQRKIDWVEEDYLDEKLYIDTSIKAELTKRYWSNDEYYRVFVDVYKKQIDLAISLFPEAVKLAQESK